MKNNINLTPKTRSGYKIFETCLKRRKHGKWITTHISPPFQQNPPLKHSLSVPKARRSPVSRKNEN